jgi:hypothetical protein
MRSIPQNRPAILIRSVKQFDLDLRGRWLKRHSDPVNATFLMAILLQSMRRG